jgi:hypothetical protein
MFSKNIMIAQHDVAFDRGVYENNPGLITMLPGHTASEQYGIRSQYEDVVIATFLAATLPGLGTQVRSLPLLLSGRLTFSQFAKLYGPTVVGAPTFGGMAIGALFQLIESRSQDEKSRPSGRSVKPKTLRGNSKPSRPVSSGQTSKPFWANGKPKCKKGFRYDFKRKLCVKIK